MYAPFEASVVWETRNRSVWSSFNRARSSKATIGIALLAALDPENGSRTGARSRQAPPTRGDRPSAAATLLADHRDRLPVYEASSGPRPLAARLGDDPVCVGTHGVDEDLGGM